jgi:hypothetical protein
MNYYIKTPSTSYLTINVTTYYLLLICSFLIFFTRVSLSSCFLALLTLQTSALEPESRFQDGYILTVNGEL